MNLVDAGLFAQLCLAAAAILLAVFAPVGHRNLAAGIGVAALGVVGAATGVTALLGVQGAGLRVPLALPGFDAIDPLTLAPDRLGGFFLAIVGVVVAVAAVFGIGYAHGPVASRTGWTAFAAFALGMQLFRPLGTH